MRRFAALTLLIASASAALATARAAGPDAPEPVKPKPVPTIEPRLGLPPYINQARRARPAGVPAHLTLNHYAEGPLSYDVEIVNPPSAALSTTLLVERLDGSPAQKVAEVPVEVAADSRAFVTFTDPGGLRDGCDVTRLRLSLQTGTSSRTLTTTPSCTFGAEPLDPTAGMPTARQASLRAGRLTYRSPEITSASLACGRPLSVRATVKNGASVTATAARLRLEGPGADGLSERFDLAPGKERVAVASLPFPGHPGSYVLRLDPAGSAPVHQPGWLAKVTRACRLEIALER
jgi:hypothetical protein